MSDSEIIQKPFGSYTDFDDCVRQNQDKANPEAYCAEIKNKVEGKSEDKDCACRMRLLKSDDGRFIIYGPASVEIKDKERDKILEKGLQLALPQLLRRGRLSLSHQDILIGEILPEFQSEGKLYKTEVANKRLMLVGDIWDDTKASRDTRQNILDKKLKSFSISGEVLPGGAKTVCDSDGCVREISKLDLHAVTVCEEGMNPAAKFDVIQKGETVEYKTIATPQQSNMKISESVQKWILMSDEEVEKAEYPWEQCIADQTAEGYSQEKSEKICAAIKNRTVAHKMNTENLPLDQAFAAVVQKVLTDPDFSYILGKIRSHASQNKEAEVTKNMADNPKPPTEAQKEEPAPAPAGGGEMADLKAMMAKMMEMMQAMMGGGGQVAAAQKEADKVPPAAPPTPDVSKELVELKEQIKKLQGGTVITTPRPDGLNKSELGDGSRISKIMKDPSMLDKMSYGELAEYME